jgi:pimeloyl-ACP methyl ester carboxylesterase
LRHRHRLIAPDLRGFGWSEAPGSGYDCETFAADQIALLDELGLDRVDVIGHDWGGWTLWILALRHPDRIRRALPLNIPHPWPRIGLRTVLDQSWRGWYAALNALPAVGPLAMRAAGNASGFLRRANTGRPFSDEEVELYADRFREHARASAAASLYRYYFRAMLTGGGLSGKHLIAPTRLLFGTRDVAISTRLVRDGWQGHADDMEVELVEDSGHFIVDEKPDLVAERALELFA